MFDAVNSDEKRGELLSLMEVEQYFFTRIGCTRYSPCLFVASHEEDAK